VETVMAIALAINSERTRCARIVEAEKEYPLGREAPMADRGAAGIVRTTKQSILDRIHSGEAAPARED
jgi:hypothetical protein